jgi:CheY-like chemotaxis protein
MARIGPLAGLDVLVVDDNPDARDLMKLVLLSDGASVTACESAWDALEAVHRNVPSVLVSDIVMPRENALWLIKEIRNLPRARGGRLPALAVTAYSAMFARGQVLGAGFDAFLEKPVDRWELCRVVATLAAGGRGEELEQDRRAG